MRTTRLRVSMREVEPAVLRVLDVPTHAWLPEVHDLLQAGLGWTDSHLHQFVTDAACYGTAPPVLVPGEDVRDESQVRLADLPERFVYLYDFGDGWTHDVHVLGPGGDRPGCVYGEGACPPEDCGGVSGYAELLEVLSDPGHPEHANARSWVGELPAFEQEDADLLVRQTVGAVPEPVRLLLELTAGGVSLTPGGRLPRRLVREVQQHYPGWHRTGAPASAEADLPPLAALHDLLREVGLLRLRRGVLIPIRAAAEDLEVLRRLRSWFGREHEFVNLLAGVALAVLSACGPQPFETLEGRVFPWFEGDWTTGSGEPVTADGLARQLSRLAPVLQGLDAIRADAGTWSPGPSACWLLPRATALAHLWARSPGRYPLAP